MCTEDLTRRRFLRLVGLASAGVALGACTPQAAPAGAPAAEPTARAASGAQATTATATTATATTAATRQGGILTYAHLGDFVTFSGHLLHANSFPMFNLLYNSLIVLDKDMKPQPELAESWQFGDENRSLTLKLRQGVKFHNGRELTSEDVKFNLEFIQDPKNSANSRPLSLLIDKVEVPDRSTVVLRLTRVAPNIFDLLDLCYIMAPESAADITKKGVGTGPFKLDEWRPGDAARFTRFPDYFKSSAPRLDGVVVRVMGDAASMVAGLENGSIDVAERFPAPEAARLQKAAGLKVHNIFAGFVADILVNTTRKPLDTRAVRQALGFGLNRQRMIDVGMGSIGSPWCIPFPVGSVGYDAEVAAMCRFDVAHGKRLLEEAGLGTGFEFELLVTTPLLPFSPLFAQIWQADLAQMGVRARIVDVEAAEYQSRTLDRRFEVAVHQFRGANRDPDTLFLSVIPWYTKNNFSQFESEAYTRLVTDGGTTADPDRRRAIYRDLGRLIVEEAFVFPIAPAPSLFGVRDRVQGLTWNVEGFPRYEDVVLAG